jgi:hypothetical protein
MFLSYISSTYVFGSLVIWFEGAEALKFNLSFTMTSYIGCWCFLDLQCKTSLSTLYLPVTDCCQGTSHVSNKLLKILRKKLLNMKIFL